LADPRIVIQTVCKKEKTFCAWCHALLAVGEVIMVDQLPHGAGKDIPYHVSPCYFERLGFTVKVWT
jgi:hypothetical protein